MEEYNRGRRPLDPPAYGLIPRTPNNERRASETVNRFRPPNASQTGAGLSHSRNGSYTYYSDGSPVHMPPVSSSVSYPAGINQGQDRSQGYNQFTSGVMYSMTQQPTTSAPYDISQPYASRDSADAAHVLSSHFAGVPPFYPQGDSSVTTTVATQTTPVSRYDPLSYGQSASLSQMGYQHGYTPTLQELTPVTQASVQDPSFDRSQSVDEEYSSYKQGVRRIFSNVRAGNLADAGQALMENSSWLLSSATELGIIRDNQDLHADRLKMWNEFNHCWLALLQKQKDMSQTFIDAAHGQALPDNIMSEDFLEKLGRELVRLCDSLERHGLVDYQMGVWEEQILELLTECVDLLDSDEDDDADEQDEQRENSAMAA